MSSMIWDGDKGGAGWAVTEERVLLAKGSGDLTPNAEQSIAMTGGGGMNSNGVELSVSDIGLDPVEFVAMTVDSGGVRVAIDVLKELVCWVVLHWGVSLSCRVLILLLLHP